MTALPRRAVLAGAGAALLGACAPEAGTVLRAVDTHPADYPTVRAVAHLAARVERETAGRLRIRQFPGGQLGEEKDTLELTVFGGLDMNRVNLAPLNAVVPETLVPTLPFLFDDVAHMRRAMDGAPGRVILDALTSHGLIGLCFYDSGARGFYTRGGPVRTPADLAGRKIRVQNSDLFVATVAALGGVATPMSYGEVYAGLLQGVIDGAENNEPSYESSRHFEAAPFFSPTAHVIAPEVLVVSRWRWERLDAPSRALLRAAAADSVGVMRTLWAARERQAAARLRAAGVRVTTDVDRAAFRARALPVWDRFLTTPALRRLAGDIRGMAAAA